MTKAKVKKPRKKVKPKAPDFVIGEGPRAAREAERHGDGTTHLPYTIPFTEDEIPDKAWVQFVGFTTSRAGWENMHALGTRMLRVGGPREWKRSK